MPINRGTHISAMIEEIKWLRPNSILDLGIGFGLLGSIFRAYTDIAKSERNPELFHSWQTRIDGIEIYEWYRNPQWDIYNNVYIGDVSEVIDTLDTYDVIYCGDMIEHIPKEKGFELIDKMLKHCARWVYVVTPSPCPPQASISGNPYEIHVSEWTLEDFSKYTYELVGNFVDGNQNLICVRIKK